VESSKKGKSFPNFSRKREKWDLLQKFLFQENICDKIRKTSTFGSISAFREKKRPEKSFSF
jgi:hypothetical protein